MPIDTETIVLAVGVMTPVYAYLHKMALQQQLHAENIQHILTIIDGCAECKRSVVSKLESELESENT